MTWILVLMLYKGGVAMQEFNTEQACLYAKDQAQATYHMKFGGSSGPMAAVCVPKGGK